MLELNRYWWLFGSKVENRDSSVKCSRRKKGSNQKVVRTLLGSTDQCWGGCFPWKLDKVYQLQISVWSCTISCFFFSLDLFFFSLFLHLNIWSHRACASEKSRQSTGLKITHNETESLSYPAPSHFPLALKKYINNTSHIIYALFQYIMTSSMYTITTHLKNKVLNSRLDLLGNLYYQCLRNCNVFIPSSTNLS